jgi:2-dehydropantoate 2-reductase
MRFVIYGAGAVGGVLGGHLAREKHDVLLVCREEHREAISEQKGIRMKSATGEYFAHLRAASTAIAGHFDDDTCVFFVPKSNDTAASVDRLGKCAPPDIPLVSFQNGIANEKVISEKFTNVYGGVCRMTCSFLHPGQVTFRKFGRLVIGKYPKGAHPFPKKLKKLLEAAGFETSVSNSIMYDKWLKLVTNLQSAFNALVDPRDHDSPEFVRLKLGVLEEAKRVLAADNIRAKSCDGKDSSINEMIDDLKKPHAPRSPSSVKVHNSTWQNLYKKRRDIENAFFHSPIIELGHDNGIPVPYNEVALELVTACGRQETGPEQLRAAEILKKIEDRRVSK